MMRKERNGSLWVISDQLGFQHPGKKEMDDEERKKWILDAENLINHL